MHLVYNSDNFVVVAFEVTSKQEDGSDRPRGGYEIVDKLARTEIFIDGDVELEQCVRSIYLLLDEHGPSRA